MIKISSMQGVVSLKISIITELDSTDMQIISILQASKKSWSAYQIHTLLEYRGIEISSSSLRIRSLDMDIIVIELPPMEMNTHKCACLGGLSIWISSLTDFLIS